MRKKEWDSLRCNFSTLETRRGNVNKYISSYAEGGSAEFIENDMFTTNVYLEKVVTTQPTTQPTMQLTMQVTPQVKKIIIACIGELTRNELMYSLNLNNREHFRKEYLKPALENDVIKMKFPEQPNHPNQKYKLTEKGESLKRQSVGYKISEKENK